MTESSGTRKGEAERKRVDRVSEGPSLPLAYYLEAAKADAQRSVSAAAKKAFAARRRDV